MCKFSLLSIKPFFLFVFLLSVCGPYVCMYASCSKIYTVLLFMVTTFRIKIYKVLHVRLTELNAAQQNLPCYLLTY